MCIKEQCINFQDVCELTGGDIYTDDIWEKQQLLDWARSDQPSLLTVQGCYESVNRLERFAAEVWEYLDSKEPTVAILQSLDSAKFFNGFDERELLRQIALQALQKVSLDHPICFLADVVQLFSEASTCEGWFRILDRVFQMLPALFVIITVTVLGERARSTKPWPHQLEELMARVQKSSLTCLKVILIATHPLWPETETPSLICVGPAPEIDSDDGMGDIDIPSEHYLPISFPIENGSGKDMIEVTEVPEGEIITEQAEQHTSASEAPEAGRPESFQQSPVS